MLLISTVRRWQQKTGHNGQFVPGDEGGENCATDGDVDIATSLFLAAKVWGRGGAYGEIDYRSSAVQLCRSIWEHCFNHETYMPLVGDWADPGDEAFALTRPSDFILSGYLIFYHVKKKERKNKEATDFAPLPTGRYRTSEYMGKCH